MAEISDARLKEVERYKAAIGWGWTEIANRLRWGPPGLQKFRMLRGPIEDKWLDYLRAVADAVQSVPLPGDEAAADIPPPILAGSLFEDEPMEDKMRAAGLMPSAPVNAGASEVKVMLLSDITEKLAAEYQDIAREPDIIADEVAGARAMIGRLAQRFGVVTELRTLLSPSIRHPAGFPTPTAPRSPFGMDVE